jgi:SAM-dependent methyltransferase
MTDDPVRAQYEAYPYPVRDPADERDRLITGSPSHVDEINHYVFAGRRDFRRPFRALIAGGGTGDGTIMLAQQLANASAAGQVVYVDASATARAIAEARAQVRGLDNIRFETCAIEDLDEAVLGAFDYVDCCGVLHHLADPQAGLDALVRMLADDGGMGLMLYGELGRTGVYPVQELLRRIGGEDPSADRLALARKIVDRLPPTNWLKRNPFVRDHLTGGDAGLFDLLLHGRDRAYRVPEIAALCTDARLRITAFVEPAAYDPDAYVGDAEVRRRMAELPWIERCAAAELLAGNMAKHVFYAVKVSNGAQAVARLESAGAIPVLWDMDADAFVAAMKPGKPLAANLSGLALSFPLPPLAAAMVARIDGERDLAAIHAGLRLSNPNLAWDRFHAEFKQLFGVLNGLGKMFLQNPAV